VDLKFIFYLPIPSKPNQQVNEFVEKDLEINFTKLVKVKDTRCKFLISTQRVATEAEFSFYYQNLETERQIALSVDSNYFKSLISPKRNEMEILAFVDACLHPDSHTVKLINIELKKLIDYEISQCPNAEYLNNWVEKIIFYIGKSMQLMDHKFRN
jgi:hypothetical protein